MHYTNQRKSNNQRVFGDIYFIVEPIKGLRYRSSLGLNYMSCEGHAFNPIYKDIRLLISTISPGPRKI